MSGYTDHAPATALVRTHPDVIAVVATTERGVRIPVALSGVVEPWGLCFGVVVLDDGETMGGLSVYTADGLYDRIDAPARGTPPREGNDATPP